ncbi:ATP-dependent DNA helicase PIF1-like [Aphis craccivora]|uniref:ATP-dependent DNA helicase PIF1-like n=1 Tax=Aphis craccivora TaxID=307492 RepID=A0A6G0VY55_APHCR|nr:ATP-dependent DNA helicase PIF1-like [Aphis craccivora]
MTINKSQFQKMSVCDLNLCAPCFSHGQLYVACSQVGKPSSLFVLVKDELTINIFHLYLFIFIYIFKNTLEIPSK